MLKYLFFIGVIISLIFLTFYSDNFDLPSVVNLLYETNFYYLSISIVLSYLAFYVRSIRWSFLLENEIKNVSIFSLFKINCSAAFVNLVFPIRLGELFKAIYGGELLKVSKSYLFGTIIIERFTDVLVLTIFLLFFLDILSTNFLLLNLIYICFILCLFIFITLILIYSENIFLIKFIGFSSQIFSNNIRFFLLSKIWKIIKSIKNQYLKKIIFKYIFLTILFWLVNFFVIYFILASINLELSYEILFFTLTVCYLGLLFPSGPAFIGSVQFIIFLGMTIVNIDELYSNLFASLFWIVLLPFSSILGLLFIINDNLHFWNLFNRKKTNNYPDNSNLNLFLKNYFDGEKISYLSSKLEKITNTKILKEFKGGSFASTLLISDSSELNVLKIQNLEESNLTNQYKWLNYHKKYNYIPSVNNFSDDKINKLIFYKLPFYENHFPMFDYVHNVTTQDNKNLINNIVNCLFENHYINKKKSYNKDNVIEFIQKKLIYNLENFSTIFNKNKILKIRNNFLINNNNYKSPVFIVEKLLKNERFINILSNQSEDYIHGDLTFENIMVKNSSDFIFLDPNPVNILNSKENDLAKLLQSSSSGYEFLQELNTFQYHDNNIKFSQLKSLKYDEIDYYIRSLLKKKLTSEQYITINFYLAVHFARMLPYKLKLNNEKSIIFFAQCVKYLNIFYEEFNEF